jgi:glycosyltransferase involved in cell wall biosynthesis
MKILYVTTVGMTMGFFTSLIKELTDQGHTVDIVTNTQEHPVPQIYDTLAGHIYEVPFSRAGLNLQNIKTIKILRKIVEDGGYDVVHCHTPNAAVSTRFACRKLRKKGLKVIYTAHGFHFYKGAPLKNWIFYPFEKICARWTDLMITINKDDHSFALEKFKKTNVTYIPGVGIDTAFFRETVIDRDSKRTELGIPKDCFAVLSVGEINANKNHASVIRALADLKDSSIHYLIAGKGPLTEDLTALSEQLGISSNVHLLGYRNDVNELYKAADIFALPSLREGLNVSVMEALASGLPVICSDIRGNRDMVRNGQNGYLFMPNDPASIIEAINKVRKNSISAEECRISAMPYDRSIINKEMLRIYSSIR